MNNFDTVREALQSLDTDHCLSLEGDDRALGVLAALASIEADHFSAADMADAQAKAFRAGVASVTVEQEPVATKLETQQFNCFHVSAEDFNRLKALPVGTKLYAAPVAQQPRAYHPEETAVREACDILTNIRDAYDSWGGWSGTKQQAEQAINLLRYGSSAETAQQPQAEVKLNYFWIQEYARQHGVDYNELCALVRKVVKAPQQAEAVPQDVGQLEYRGNSVAYIHQKMTAYRGAVDAAWQAMRDAGHPPDGSTPLAQAITKALAPQQAEAVPGDVVRDAERYRWLFSGRTEDELNADVLAGRQPIMTAQDQLIADFSAWYTLKKTADAAIDAAIAAQGAKT